MDCRVQPIRFREVRGVGGVLEPRMGRITYGTTGCRCRCGIVNQRTLCTSRGDHSRPQEPSLGIRIALRAHTKRPERLETLLLVVALATLNLWLLGLAATDRHCVRRFQANTERQRPVHSTVFLGQELWRKHRYKVRLVKLFEALKRRKLLVIQEASYAWNRRDLSGMVVRRH